MSRRSRTLVWEESIQNSNAVALQVVVGLNLPIEGAQFVDIAWISYLQHWLPRWCNFLTGNKITDVRLISSQFSNKVYCKCFATKSSWQWATCVHCQNTASAFELKHASYNVYIIVQCCRLVIFSSQIHCVHESCMWESSKLKFQRHVHWIGKCCWLFQKYLCNGLLAAKANLVELDLSDNAFGPNGMVGLTEFLRSSSCYSLCELRLNNNGLGIQGGKVWHLFVHYRSSH